jgi:hypothetical protein
MLGADVVVRQRPRFILSQDDHVPRTLGKSLKHDPRIPPPAVAYKQISSAA